MQFFKFVKIFLSSKRFLQLKKQKVERYGYLNHSGGFPLLRWLLTDHESSVRKKWGLRIKKAPNSKDEPVLCPDITPNFSKETV